MGLVIGRNLACGLACLALTAMSSSSMLAQRSPGGDGPRPSQDTIAPSLNTRLLALERAQGVLFSALIAGTGKVDESAVLQRMTRQLGETGAAPDLEADKGFDALGPRGARTIRRAYAFHREVVAIYAGRPPSERKVALDAALRKYQEGPEPALPDAAKDMSILYDHPYSPFVPPVPPESEPRRKLAYPTLTGFMWAARWYQLAVLEALEPFGAPGERDRDLATVAARLGSKLPSGSPPYAFPEELPLAPAIAPGLVALHDRSASVIDNLNMMLEVLTDVLEHPAVADRRAALDTVIAQFTNRQYRCVSTDEWILVALRHSIFAQGGFALAAVTVNERNAFSGVHGQHYGPRRPPPPCEP